MATACGRASASSAAARGTCSFILRSSPAVTLRIRTRAEWNVNRSDDGPSSRALRISGSSASIVVFELGTTSPTR